ncbi:phosphate transport system permease protein PstA [Phocicoccus schoeneichii]|uniref:Phosphate transport system permease protein PstA n=1 Tax=Phocicoccus schoeneichii TaxID=1812261 RepID=A0A6V7RI89_9BACL|nr:phosphate ABC transporter permease PstA [Jeotgalicoccus schoeneichii]GGH48146.1 phosphate transport system permease protein PstA [Jeotgalicoccus schoeneichii]CAD2077043.1 Phosphate transport system permease protein PstA [Jeotgalicoccus schoeneichii]
MLLDANVIEKKRSPRLMKNSFMKMLFLFSTLIGLVVLVVLLGTTLLDGWKYLTVDFFTNFSSSRPSRAGIKGAILGTLWLMAFTTPIAIFLSVGTALYLEEYAPKNKFTKFVETNIANLAGVPSVVFGLLGLTIFVRQFGLGNSVIAASLTLSLMIMPVIVVASQEALRTVPLAVREASIGMGASKWQTVSRIILPAAIPGIITGIILAISRAIGETAPLVVIGIPVALLTTPSSPLDSFQALPMQIYNWVKMPQAEFQNLTAAAIIVLLALLLMMNFVAIIIRNKYSKRF